MKKTTSFEAQSDAIAPTNLQKRNSKVLDALVSRCIMNKRMRLTIDSAAIKSLPEELLIEILGKVAASSSTDLFNAKLADKDFLEASEDGYIFQHVSLQSFEKVPWKNVDKFRSFMKNCNKNGNAEALYRHGMLEFFSHCKEASGLANLKASAQKGHLEASYVYGVVLYSVNLKDEGVEFLKSCEAKLGAKMAECRRRVKGFVRDIWINNHIFSPEKEVPGRRRSCESCDFVIKNNCKRWNWVDEEDNYGEHTCETCKWNGEILRFCNMLRTGRYN